MRARGGEPLRPFGLVEVQRGLGQRPVAALLGGQRGGAVVVIVADRLEPAGRGGAAARLADDDIAVAEIVEQRRQFGLEQRQPMLHPGQPPPVADRFVQRIAGRRRAERGEIARAEVADAGIGQQHLVDRQQRERFGGLDGALRRRIEAPHRLDLVAEEVEPQRVGLARREQVEQPAAHCIFTRVDDGVGADIAVGGEHRRQCVAVDAAAGLERCGQRRDARRGQRPLQRGVDRGDQQLGTGVARGQRGECSHAVAGDAHRRRRAVIGQAVPGGEVDRRQLGREIGYRIEHRARRGVVGGDEHRATGRGTRDIGHQPRQIARRAPGERQRTGRGDEVLEVDQCIPTPSRGRKASDTVTALPLRHSRVGAGLPSVSPRSAAVPARFQSPRP